MRIADGIEMLTLTLNRGGGQVMIIHPTLVYDGNEIALIDTGMPGFYPEIMKQLEAADLKAGQLKTVILTHQDIDHVGSLPEFMAADDSLAVLAHPLDKPYIDGEKLFVKFTPERKQLLLSQLPDTLRLQFEAAFSISESPNVTSVIEDGQTLPYGGGLTVIATPGHTPGHVCLYHPASRTLIAGDALTAQDGKLMGPNPAMTPDMELAMASVKKLAALDVKTIICYHGGIVDKDAKAQLDALAG